MSALEARANRKVSFNEGIERHPYDVPAYLNPNCNTAETKHRPQRSVDAQPRTWRGFDQAQFMDLSKLDSVSKAKQSTTLSRPYANVGAVLTRSRLRRRLSQAEDLTSQTTHTRNISFFSNITATY
jgi:hypothetical protein